MFNLDSIYQTHKAFTNIIMGKGQARDDRPIYRSGEGTEEDVAK